MSAIWQQEVSYPDLAVPEPGKGRTEIAEGIYWLRFPLPFALDHVNLWLLADGDGWTLVDCGIGLEAAQGLWRELILGQLDGLPIKRVIVTHYHPDHLGQAAWLSRYFQASVWMTETEYATARRVQQTEDRTSARRLVEFFSLHGLGGERIQAITSRGNRYRQLVPELPPTVEILKNADRISIGGDDWQVITGGGHSPEHAALYCAQRMLLISGDQLLPRISSNISVFPDTPDADPLAAYLSALTDLSALPQSLKILPSHGRVFQGLHVRIQQLRDHHQERLDRLREACAHPRSAAEVLGTLFDRELDDHQIVFAMGEAIAHLNHLHQAGVVERFRDGDRLKFCARS